VILSALEALPIRVLAPIGVLSAVAMAFVDNATGHEITIDAFYVIPVAFASWCRRSWPGFVTGVVAAGGWYIVDQLTTGAGRGMMIRIWDAAMLLAFLSTVSFLVGRLRAALDRERKHARTDYLTGVANKRTFYELAEREVHRAAREPEPLSLVFLDIDDFKQVNDRFGHIAADDAIRDLAAVLKSKSRRTDVVARMGGDEFAVLLPETDEKGAAAYVESLKNLIAARDADRGFQLSCSFGIATFQRTPKDVNEIVRVADEAVYEAKAAGKNTLRQRVEGTPANARVQGDVTP
jgi:diguanylate cyclase (GGDEF)-like protein